MRHMCIGKEKNKSSESISSASIPARCSWQGTESETTQKSLDPHTSSVRHPETPDALFDRPGSAFWLSQCTGHVPVSLPHTSYAYF